MAKEFVYKGLSEAELKKLDAREFAKILPSRRRRTVLRGFDKIENFVQSCNKKIAENKKIKTQRRDMLITPQLVGMKIHIYNGKEYNPVDVTWEMIGHRLGEFSLTRRKVEHSAPGIGATRSSAALSVK